MKVWIVITLLLTGITIKVSSQVKDTKSNAGFKGYLNNRALFTGCIILQEMTFCSN